MAIIAASQNLSSVTYTRGETLTITNGAILTVDSTPSIRPGTIQCITSGKLLIQNNSSTTPIIFELDDINHDFRFESAGIFEIKGQPLSLGVGNGGALSWNFNSLFGGVIKTMTYCEIEDAPGSGKYIPWSIIDEDPIFNLNVGINTTIGGSDPTGFTAGNTEAGRVLFWHETNRTLRCGDNTNGKAIPLNCAVRIPNIYISNRFKTNATRVMNVITQGVPTGGSFTLGIRNEAGTLLGTTAAIAYNASAATVDAAIEAVTGASTVTSGGGPLPAAVTVTWAGSLTTGFGDFPSVYVASSALTGGTNSTASVYENNAGNLSLIDLSPLGTLDAEWVSFSHKIRILTDAFSSVRFVCVGTGSDTMQLNNSNGSVYIDGFSRCQSPFVSGVSSQLTNIYGDVTVKRVSSAMKTHAFTISLSVCPNVMAVEDITGIVYGKRNNTSNRMMSYATLPAGLTFKNVTFVGSSCNLTNLTDPVFVNPKYADGTTNVQDSTQAMNGFVLANCINPLFANFTAAGPQMFRGVPFLTDAACSNLKVFGATADLANNSASGAYLGCTGNVFQNVSFSNVRSGPFVDTVSTYLANNSILKKVLGSFATAQTNTGLDASTGGQYDLVSSEISGITETFSGVKDFVGGNYATPGLTPTTGHVTFGPFATGTSLVLSGASYTDALGGVFLQNINDSFVATMPFSMHGITSFQNAEPYLYADVPGAIANQAVVGAPGAPTGGTFTISVYDSTNTLLGTTAAIAYNASTATLVTELQAISGVGVGVSVSGSLTAGYGITFSVGQLFILTADGALLTGGTEPGVVYAVGRARLFTGTEMLGSLVTAEFGVRVPGGSWNSYSALTGANLSNAISGLTGYSAGGAGLDMRLRLTTSVYNPLLKINQISLLTNIDPTLWTVPDASIQINGAEATDIIKVLRASDDAILYTFTGSGIKEFTIGNNFDTAVYFQRETAANKMLMVTYPTTIALSFGDNGEVNLYYGSQVQLAQSTDIQASLGRIETDLDIDVTLTTELHAIAGLKTGTPMTVTPTTRTAGTVSLAITGDGVTTTTVTRT